MTLPSSDPLVQGFAAQPLEPVPEQHTLPKHIAVLVGLYDNGAGTQKFMPVRVDANGYVLTKAAP